MKAAVRDAVVPVAVLSGGIPRADLESAGAHAVYQDPPTSSDVWDSRRLRPTGATGPPEVPGQRVVRTESSRVLKEGTASPRRP